MITPVQIIGQSLPMQNLQKQILQAAASDIPVFLIGETGTGKDLVAQAIHQSGKRQSSPYVPVNLSALPTQLVASELFGHEKGAFTGALKQHRGKFEQAHDGTIFLDEIDSVDERVQVSLLRIIEQKKFHRLGGKRSITSNARIIAATNADADDLLEGAHFRDDLFYRLDVFRITLAPLRKRHGDIPLLVDNFIQKFNPAVNKSITKISGECTEILAKYDWPGNVRELKNVIQRAMLVCPGATIQIEHLPPRFRNPDSDIDNPKITFTVGTPLEEVERQMILKALSVSGNNRTKAAQLLGISRRAIYNKLKKHNID